MVRILAVFDRFAHSIAVHFDALLVRQTVEKFQNPFRTQKELAGKNGMS
jgi:hypothetical protein